MNLENQDKSCVVFEHAESHFDISFLGWLTF